ncbi:MAG: transcription termination/antitermination protein NusG [Candidatus Nomurabacteria bacterium]|jgi:transcriptional antiterminator NusG|nr:transcription termination/antitermination protein NusG [Candidatus Nomurabacteria bacterium]
MEENNNTTTRKYQREISRYDTDRAWYAINTYSGHEDKVAEAIKQKAESADMADYIFDVLVPKEKQIEVKNGARKVVDRKIFQGYVLVDMILTDESWYVVRNTQGVSGFVGIDGKPTPLANAEIAKIKKRMGVEDPKYTISYEVGEIVTVIDGPFKGFDGSISEIDSEKGRLHMLVSMFGREMPIELDALQVKKID